MQSSRPAHSFHNYFPQIPPELPPAHVIILYRVIDDFQTALSCIFLFALHRLEHKIDVVLWA